MVEINPILCKSCGYCVRFCPKQVLSIGKTRNKRGFFYPELSDPDNCISCAVCATVCPEGAIELPGKGGENDG
ncbi:MAG: ferredoxin family protein [Clostridia bacterium]|nr:ferredoxin family protein [Clostridia bacterium]